MLLFIFGSPSIQRWRFQGLRCLWRAVLALMLLAQLLACSKKAPRPEQVWGELEKLGQALHAARREIGRFDDDNTDPAGFVSYPQRALPAGRTEKMLATLNWLEPALTNTKNMRFSRLLRAQILYEQQRQQDARRHYRPLGPWPKSFNDQRLKQRRYQRQLAAQGLVVDDPKPLYHQALRELGELQRASAAQPEALKAAPCQVSPAKADAFLPDWQGDLRSLAQKQGAELFCKIKNCKKNQCVTLKTVAALRAAVDVGIAVLALPRARVVRMFKAHSRLHDDEIADEIKKIRLHQGRAMARWMGLRAYETATDKWLQKGGRAAAAVNFWRYLRRQGPLDVQAIIELAQAAPSDPSASADQKPGPERSTSAPR